MGAITDVVIAMQHMSGHQNSDKIHVKSNAPEILENQLKAWKSKSMEPVMISSVTDAYQPAELKFE